MMMNSQPPSISVIIGGFRPSLLRSVGISCSDSGSSPYRLIVIPGELSRMAFLALCTGIGHLRPMTSTFIGSSDNSIPQLSRHFLSVRTQSPSVVAIAMRFSTPLSQ